MTTIQFIRLKIKCKYIFICLISCIYLLTNSIKSQNISTVEEIYDFEIGDIFHFYFSAEAGWSGMTSITNVEILYRYYSSNNDTIFYIRDIDYQEISDSNPVWTYSYYIDTLFYYNLDSLINSGDIDSVYSNINFYNGRTINYKEYNDTYSNWNMKFVNGCGKTSEQYYSEEYNSESSNELVYYKKGEEEWGLPIIVSIEDREVITSNISIFPNPAKNYINIFVNESEVGDLTIFSINGKKIKAFELNSKLNIIDVSGLSFGVYIVNISINGQTIHKKLIKE